MSQVLIRPINPEETHQLKDFLYEAIYLPEGAEPIPRFVVELPHLRVYYEDFGRRGDHCLVAECDGQLVGAVWTRLLTGDSKGYGYVDDETPELAIALYKKYRSGGVGTVLMTAMLQLLKAQGYKKTSLAVKKENFAAKLYLGLGYQIVHEDADEVVMVYELTLNTGLLQKKATQGAPLQVRYHNDAHSATANNKYIDK